MRNLAEHTFDHILVGGGLQNGLIAWLLLSKNPDARVVLIEAGASLGGNHTWSFHADDVPEDCAKEIEPLAAHRWNGYQVHFPDFSRTLSLGYCSMHASHLDRLLRAKFAECPRARLLLSTPVTEIHRDHVKLEHGEVLRGTTVIDARGPVLNKSLRAQEGYQKFVGLELSLSAPAPVQHPIIMDACVDQDEGYRFFYVLPYASDRVLIEETRFSEDPSLDIEALARGVLNYATARGYAVREVLRRETGVLPMPYVPRIDWPTHMPLQAGYRGGFMHPATGYSFPVALRVALHIAAHAPASPLGADWDLLIKKHRRQYRFATFLNRLLFTAYAAGNRRDIFRRFYAQPEAGIARFYRLELEGSDMARMFVGRPPRGFSLKRMVEGALHR